MPFSWAAAQGLGERRGDLEDLGDGSPPSGHSVEGLALDELHGEEVDPVRLLDRVDGDDPGVVERGEGLRLALEAGEPLGVPAISAGSTLRATSRPSFVSVARYTSPIPPAPIAAVTR